MTKSPGRRSVTTWFFIIAAAGFALRLVHLLQARGSDPLFNAPQLDMLYHHQWATAIANGVDFVPGPFFRAPLYPWLLGGIYSLFGPSVPAARFAQAVLGGLTCGLLYLLARRILSAVSALPARASRWAARGSGLALAAWPLAIYYDTELLAPVVLVPLLLLGGLLFYRSWDQDRQWWLPGLALGAAAIARPNALAVLAALTGWLFVEYRSRAWKKAAALVGAAALVILPVTVRNLVKGGEPVLIASQAGVNFYIGNNPGSDGATASLPGTGSTWWGRYEDVRRLAERETGQKMGVMQVDRFWFGKGLEFWRHEPARALALLARKAYLLAWAHELPNNRDLYALKRHSFLDWLLWRTRWLKFPFGLLLPLALAGAWLLRRSTRRLVPAWLFLGAYGLSFLPFFVTARFRLPLVPLLLVPAAASVGWLATRSRQSRRDSIIGLLVAAAVFIPVNADLVRPAANRFQEAYATASALHQQDRLDEALPAVRAALAEDSSISALNLETQVLAGLDRLDEARAAAEAALRLGPQVPEAMLALGAVQARQGLYDEAAGLFRAAVRLDSGSVEGWINLANIALLERDTAAARARFRRARVLDPGNATVLYGLGLLEMMVGNKAIARQHWRQALRLRPNHRPARQALDRMPWP
ncbi:glycosyltransferase family 39 protein [candidate division WOR-3 bacterium]|nr:glycosyltransferase family 39 protein [candidate division WOR-3 bacterium]